MDITKDSFEREVLQSTELVLVDFHAPWCGPCRRLTPILNTLQNVKVVKVNTDEQPDLTQDWRINALPTLKFFKNGNAVATIVGLVTKESLDTKINELNK